MTEDKNLRDTQPEEVDNTEKIEKTEQENDAVPAMAAAERRRAHTKKTLIVYGILMAAFVMVLIAVSYLNQMRVEREMSETLEQLNAQTANFEGAERNIAILQQENTVLKKEFATVSARKSELEAENEQARADIERLQDGYDQLAAQSAEQDRQKDAQIKLLDGYASLLTRYSERDYKACKELIASMEADGSAAKLPADYQKRYMEILKAVD